MDCGFVAGTKERITLKKGVYIDRYGNSGGKFASPVNTPYDERSLGPFTKPSDYHIYKIIKLIENVDSGKALPWGSWKGMGTQYYLPESINSLINKGYIIEV